MTDPVVEQTPDGIAVTVVIETEGEESEPAADNCDSEATEAAKAVLGTAGTVVKKVLGAAWDIIKPEESPTSAEESDEQ